MKKMMPVKQNHCDLKDDQHYTFSEIIAKQQKISSRAYITQKCWGFIKTIYRIQTTFVVPRNKTKTNADLYCSSILSIIFAKRIVIIIFNSKDLVRLDEKY